MTLTVGELIRLCDYTGIRLGLDARRALTISGGDWGYVRRHQLATLRTNEIALQVALRYGQEHEAAAQALLDPAMEPDERQALRVRADLCRNVASSIERTAIRGPSVTKGSEDGQRREASQSMQATRQAHPRQRLRPDRRISQ